MRFKARAAMVFQFFTRCASSTINSSGAGGDQIEIGLEFLVVGDLAAGFRNWITDPKLGEKRFARQIFQPKSLLATELTAQAALPVHRRQVGRRKAARELGFLARLGRGLQVSG
jgi:hypothetical protein